MLQLAVANESPDTEHPAPQLWHVELETFERFQALHAWTGYATNSVEATIEAKLDYFGRTGHDTSTPMRVCSCVQVGV